LTGISDRAGRVPDPSGAPGAVVLDLRLAESRQLFNMMDPAPFRERDLDPVAEEYIVDWGRETAPRQPLALSIHLSRERATPAVASLLTDAIHSYFRERAAATRRELKRLFRDGRISLAIGLAFVGVAVFASEFVAALFAKDSYATIVKDSIVIGAWVALWRPMEIFFYDWWPIRRKAKLYDRLAAMEVRVLDDPSAAPGSAPA
jgi:hypothetical protein